MTKARNNKAPGFLLVRLALYAVGAAAGAFGVSGWLETMTPDALVLAGMTALSIIVVPMACEVIGLNRWSFFLIPVAVIFGAVNAFSFHHAVDAKIEAPRRAAYQAEVVAGPAKVYADAQAAVINHAMPVFPADLNSYRIKAQTEAWEKAHAALEKAEARAKAAVDAVPGYVPFVDDMLVWTVAIAIDVALALALAGITLVRASMQKQIDRRRAAERAAREVRAAKAAKLAAKAPRARKARVVTPLEQSALLEARGPHLTVVRS